MRARWVVAMSALAQLTACCVARGTRVRTPRGLREVEALAVGDEVLVVDPVLHARATAQVRGVRVAKRECARLWTRLGPLTLTTDHPLFDPSRLEWAPAGDWILGLRTSLLLVDDERVSEGVVVRVERFVGVEEVFDLSIDHPLHDFVAEGVLVHNKPPAQGVCPLPDGSFVEVGLSCTCANGSRGTMQCGLDGFASCASCASADAPGTVLTEWSPADLAGDGGWTSACNGADALAVVPGAPLGWTRSPGVLRVRAPSDGGCALLTRAVAIDGGHTGQLFFRSDMQGGAQGLVQLGPPDAPWLTLLEREGVDGGDLLSFSVPDGGAPWRSATVLPRGAWFRLEWTLELPAPSRARLSARVFDAQDTLVISTWRREGLLLSDWYEQGNTFATGPRALLLGTAAGGTGEGELFFGSLVLRP